MDQVVTDFASSNALNEADGKDQAWQQILTWLQALKDLGRFRPVPNEILQDGRRIFKSDGVSDQQTLEIIKSY